MNNFFDLVLDSTVDTFGMIVFWLFIVIFVFNYIDKKFNKSISNFVKDNRKLNPILGSAVGLVPGCGGGLFAFQLYKDNKMSFSGLLPALISSLGALAFFLMTTQWQIYLIIISTQFVIGILIGYILILIKKDFYYESVKTEDKKENIREKKKLSKNVLMIDNFILPAAFVLFMISFSFVGVMVSLAPNGEESLESLVAVKYFIFVFMIIISIWYLSRKVLKYLKYDFNNNYINSSNQKKKFNELVNDPVKEIISISTIVWLVTIVITALSLTGYEEAFNNFVSNTSNLPVLIVIAAAAAFVPTCGFQIIFSSALIFSFTGAQGGVITVYSDYFWFLFIPLFVQTFITIGDLAIPVFIQDKNTWLKASSVNFISSLTLAYTTYGILVISGAI
ncbi:MAG: arsenic efflux protein [Mycoplasmataceae bacterium]|nr:arsenic efflux protein [Mycoplasmataceae bacterium]